MDKSRSIWKQLKASLEGANSNLTPVSMILRGVNIVAVVADKQPPISTERIIDRYLSQGTQTTLPDEVLDKLWERREDRLSKTNLTSATGYVYEGHTPTPIEYRHPDTDKISNDAHMREVVKELHSQGYPFIAVYSLYAGYKLGYQTGMVDSDNPLKDLIKEALTHADRYLFTESARLMHHNVHTGDISFIPLSDASVWIEQDSPQSFTFNTKEVQLKAIHIFRTSLKGQWCINVIDDTTKHLMSMTYEEVDGLYSPTIDYECPYGLCEDYLYPYESMGPNNYMVYRKPCKQCDDNALLWASLIHTYIEMIQRKYATSSDPKPFKERNLSYTEKRLVPRIHGKGKPKEKPFTVDIPYIVIEYEVSVTKGTQLHIPSPEDTTEKRDNWLSLSSPEDRIYQRRYIAEVERHYRGSHYEHLKQRCLAEGPVTEDGKEYRIEIDDTGETVIIGKVVQHHKYVPLLRSDVKKTPVIKKVTAKRFKGTS